MTKQQLIITGIVALFLVSVGGYAWYGKKGAQPEPIVSSTTKTIPTTSSLVVQASSSVPTTVEGITYITKTYFLGDQDNGMSRVEIISGLSESTLDTINKKLRIPFEHSEFGDPETPSALADIRQMYKDKVIEARKNANTTSGFSSDADVDTMTYLEVRDKLTKDFQDYESVWENVKFLDKNVLSILAGSEASCGWSICHNLQAINFDVSTGNTFEFKDFFKDYEKDKKKIEVVVFSRIESESSFEGGECNYKEDYRNGDISGDTLSVLFSREGLVTESLGYDGAQNYCNDSYVIPFSLLKPYINTNAPFMKSANLEAK